MGKRFLDKVVDFDKYFDFIKTKELYTGLPNNINRMLSISDKQLFEWSCPNGKIIGTNNNNNFSITNCLISGIYIATFSKVVNSIIDSCIFDNRTMSTYCIIEDSLVLSSRGLFSSIDNSVISKGYILAIKLNNSKVVDTKVVIGKFFFNDNFYNCNIEFKPNSKTVNSNFHDCKIVFDDLTRLKGSISNNFYNCKLSFNNYGSQPEKMLQTFKYVNNFKGCEFLNVK